MTARQEFARLTDGAVLELAAQALRQCEEIRTGTAEWQAAAARYKQLAQELAWREIDRVMEGLGRPLG